MMINEAQAQATATSGRGDGQYPSGLHDGGLQLLSTLDPVEIKSTTTPYI
ncbi:hypothetical protein ACX3VI_03985 [Escherichia coli]